MVADKIENLRSYERLNCLFTEAFDYLEKTDFGNLELGKHTIKGEEIFALLQEYQTKDIKECMLEGHSRYIDIQYLVAGKEFIGIASRAGQIPHIAYDATKDIAFYQGDYSLLKLEAGNFAILFPDDLHMPCVKVDDTLRVRKVVLKVRA